MKCPKCGFVSFNYLETCRKCGRDLNDYRQARGFSDTAPQPMDIGAPVMVEEGAAEEEDAAAAGENAGVDTGFTSEAGAAEAGEDIAIRMEEFPEDSVDAGVIPEPEEEIDMISEEEDTGEPVAADSGEVSADEGIELEEISFEEEESEQEIPSLSVADASSEPEETLNPELENDVEGGEPGDEAPSLELEELELTLEEDDEETEDDSDEDDEDRNNGSRAGGEFPEDDPGADGSSASFEIKMEDAEEIRGIIEDINQSPKDRENPGSLTSWEEAGVGRRLLAYATDHLLLGLAALLLTGGALRIFLSMRNPLTSPVVFLQTLTVLVLALAPWISVLLILYAGYYFCLVGSQGQTLGQALFGIRVVSEDRGPVGFLRAALRLGGALLSWVSLGLGFLWAAVDRRHQGWPEKMSGTLVVLS